MSDLPIAPISPLAPTMPVLPIAKYSKKDFVTDQAVKWCPGCGDYAILSQAQSVFSELGIPREKLVMVSGIGCSSRFPYYVHAYGFHTIHGRAPTIATGVKLSNPELSVWIATGDGDSLSIGGNHTAHMLRRNIDLQVLLFNNRIYGLTKGQYSPTSELGKKTKTSPYGSLDHPFEPLLFALGSGATFVARSVDSFQKEQREVLKAAHDHKGTSFVEIYQNCVIFNEGAFCGLTDKAQKDDHVLFLEHGKPMLFGKGEKGIRLRGVRPEVIELNATTGLGASDCLVHDQTDPYLAGVLCRMNAPEFPAPMGVLHRRDDVLTYDQLFHEQIAEASERQAKKGGANLDALLHGAENWIVK